MPTFRIVLVRPENEGNIGAVARSMSNFGFNQLYLVDPVPITDEARRRAKHGNNVLSSARTFSGLREAISGSDYIVGTTGIRSSGERKFLRHYESPREFAERIAHSSSDYSLLFGPEGLGLRNTELALCDSIVSIPTHDRYPVMNLSHAVTVLLYELFMVGFSRPPERLAISGEKNKIMEYYSALLEEINYPPHKRKKAELMFRRLVGRQDLSKWEFFILMGVLSRTLGRLKGKDDA